VTETPHPEFGVPWAAKGEERPSQFLTPLAWVAGHEGGLLFIQRGEADLDGCAYQNWMGMSGWNRWVMRNEAAPVKPDSPDDAQTTQ
jgi:hypothetical protein